MTIDAAETLAPNSSASFGSIGSTERCEMPELNPASARSRIASRGAAALLGRKPLHPPGVAGARVEQPVVQPVGAPLPELDALRQHAIAAPMRGAGWLLVEARASFFERFFELGAGGNGFALRRSPRRE